MNQSTSTKLDQISNHTCINGCECSSKGTQAAMTAVVPIEDQPNLGVLISEDLRAQGIENPLLHKAGKTGLSDKEKIQKMEN